jgi:hypothetical protein
MDESKKKSLFNLNMPFLCFHAYFVFVGVKPWMQNVQHCSYNANTPKSSRTEEIKTRAIDINTDPDIV